MSINVAQEQLEDRIDEAVSLFTDYHYDSTETAYLKYTITQADKDNKFLTLPDNVIDVLEIVKQSDNDIFTNANYRLKYETALNNFMSVDMSNYAMNASYLSLIDTLFDSGTTVSFTRHLRKLLLYIEWDDVVANDSFVVLRVEQTIPSSSVHFWNDTWLKKYSTALIKKQWGQNMKKFSGVKLAGGIELDGQTIYNEADQELERLENELEEKYSEPPLPLIG